MSQSSPVFSPPIIPPLVTRHAGDAAFYWQQRDGSMHSPLAGLPQLLEFDRLLDAHLDGLRAAGNPGWDIALAQLQRWARAPEVFVCATLALEHADASARLAEVLEVVQQNPGRMLRGLISALAWVPAAQCVGWCRRWLDDEQTPTALAVAAWRALAIQYSIATQQPTFQGDGLQAVLHKALPIALTSPDVHLRAAACRFLAQLDEQHLLAFLKDPEPSVRVEAAIGLMQGLHPHAQSSKPESRLTAHQRRDQKSQAARVLWLATNTLSQDLTTLTGLHRNQAQHRLMRWLRHLALAVPMGHADVAALLTLLPSRLGLWFVLHHGDGHYLPWVVQRMTDPDVSRLAGWVWSVLTGVDLYGRGLALPPRALKQAPRTTDTHDPGLPEPDASAIARLGLTLPALVVSLYGQAVNPAVLRYSLWRAPQAIRWMATKRLAQLGASPINIRTHARLQQAQLQPLPEAQAA